MDCPICGIEASDMLDHVWDCASLQELKDQVGDDAQPELILRALRLKQYQFLPEEDLREGAANFEAMIESPDLLRMSRDDQIWEIADPMRRYTSDSLYNLAGLVIIYLLKQLLDSVRPLAPGVLRNTAVHNICSLAKEIVKNLAPSDDAWNIADPYLRAAGPIAVEIFSNVIDYASEILFLEEGDPDDYGELSPSGDMAEEAAQILGYLDQYAIGTLSKLVQSTFDSSVRERAIRSLGAAATAIDGQTFSWDLFPWEARREYLSQAISAIAVGLYDNDPDVRDSALEELTDSEFSQSESHVIAPLIISILERKDWSDLPAEFQSRPSRFGEGYGSIKLVEALSKLADPSAIPVLLDTIISATKISKEVIALGKEKEAARIRSEAARKAWITRRIRAMPRSRRVRAKKKARRKKRHLKYSINERLRRVAVETLGDIGRSTEEESVKRYIVEALCDILDVSMVRTLSEGTIFKEAEDSNSIFYQAASVEIALWREVLDSLYGMMDEDGLLPANPSLIRSLEVLINTPIDAYGAPWDRELWGLLTLIIKSFGRVFDGRPIVPILINMLQNPFYPFDMGYDHSAVGEAVVNALGQIGDPAALPILILIASSDRRRYYRTRWAVPVLRWLHRKPWITSRSGSWGEALKAKFMGLGAHAQNAVLLILDRYPHIIRKIEEELETDYWVELRSRQHQVGDYTYDKFGLLPHDFFTLLDQFGEHRKPYLDAHILQIKLLVMGILGQYEEFGDISPAGINAITLREAINTHSFSGEQINLQILLQKLVRLEGLRLESLESRRAR